MGKLSLATAAIFAFAVCAFASHIVGTSGTGTSYPDDYVPVILGNGSISTSVDYLGKQIQKKYVTFYPETVWEGRRYPPTIHGCKLMTMGHFDDEISVDGKPLGKPLSWKQSLDTTNAFTETEVEYADAVVKTKAFVPYGLDMLVVRKTVEPKSKSANSAEIKFKYLLTELDSGKAPERFLVSPKSDAKLPNAASIFYTAYAYRTYEGEISVIASAPAKVVAGSADVSLDSSFDLSKGAASCDYFISYADNFQGDAKKCAAALKETVAQKGFDGILADHKESWRKFWGDTFINLPDKPMQDAYQTALYHLNSTYTKWSIPVSLFGHQVGWSGRFFGWDEMFCVMGAVSSGKFDLSVRTTNFRRAMLNSAMNRVAHYGKIVPKMYGARYPWESLEDGREGAPNPYGFWFDHVFHMSNIAASAWRHYLFTGDKKFLEEKAYPVIRECAAFYYSHMLQPNGDKLVIGKCTDIERLGPAVENPFLTSCGAIYNFEVSARAAKILGVDEDYSKKLLEAAAKLRQSLPQNDEMYVPFKGCTEKSIVAIGGLFPYEIFDGSEKKQVAALYDFMKNISSAGNMYPVGNSTCSWYAAWLSVALEIVGDNEGPEKMLAATARNTGRFAETWEINEPKTRHTPWFTTSAGNYVHAVNQMLVNPRENGEIDIAVSAPKKWKNYSFKLPTFGGGNVAVKVADGKIASLDYAVKDSQPRTIIVPQYLIPSDKVSKSWKVRGDKYLIPVGDSFSL